MSIRFVAALAASIAVAASLGSAYAASAEAYIPYTGMGDPAGLTLTPPADELVTGSVGKRASVLPYTGMGDPDGLALTVAVDATTTGSIVTRGTGLPYSGMGDPEGLALTVPARL